MLRYVAGFSLLWLASFACHAETIAGPIRVIDADTIRVGGVKVRLYGIDAPELEQPCELADARVWACGLWASDRVSVLYDGAWAICTRRDTDRYGRAVATCRVDGADMGARLVRDGVAEAYRAYALDYVAAEKAAYVKGLGLWRGRVQAPSDFRHTRVTAATASARNCEIKGNISGGGRLYHLPGQAHYGETRISEVRGERWFCSEEQAQRAGWRRARR